MTAGRLIFPGFMPALDDNGDPIPGARAYFYADGTTTLANTYTSNALSTANANPVVADGVGVWPAMWADTTSVFTVSLTDDDGAPLPVGTWSGVSAAIDATLASAALAESAQAAAEAARDDAEDARDTAQAISTALGDLDSAVTDAEAAAAAAAASAAAAAAFDPTTYALKATTVSAGGLATGGGSLAANRTITVTAAASADVLTGTSTSKAMTVGDTYSALSEVTLTYGATVTPDMATFINAVVTLTGNVTLANPTNPKPGQSGRIRIIQDGTGSRLLSAVGSFWKRSGGAPTLTTTASAYDVLVYDVISTTLIVYDLIRNPS